MARDPQNVRSIARNRKARHRFEVLEALECGVELAGTEVKSLRAGRASISEAYGRIRGGELWLVGANIPEYTHGSAWNHEPARDRRLLAHRRQIASWDRRVRDKGITLVPLHLYFRGHLVKVELALVRGRKVHDAREDKARRAAEREISRALRRRR